MWYYCYYPQTLFVGYATLDQLIAGKFDLNFNLLIELLSIKLLLSSFSLGSGLIGGMFAPSLFFGAILGTIYQQLMSTFTELLINFITWLSTITEINNLESILSFLTIAGAPAYAAVSLIIYHSAYIYSYMCLFFILGWSSCIIRFFISSTFNIINVNV